ncbi:serine hydrolase [Fulvivirga sediminis]|uniref:Serine hydrolase n=1 Tax=Fulvivirga sediminis TaxID=2803949 RepID=A0A937F6H3_9BACT|nr:serine hydrolase [Fulvivirga sediminis]MBL3654873.1 serine hydrolase [Fulvivirga sediminis]
MKRSLIFILCHLLISHIYAQNPTQQADSLVDKIMPEKKFGLSVLLVEGDEVRYELTKGYADVESQTKVNDETIFRVGSITKQFTAVAVLTLVRQGKLSLEDPLIKFIPDFPKGDKVKIKHLLNHTSGIKNFTDDPDFLKQVSKRISTAEMVKHIQQLGYDFEPGEEYKYNNSAYYLLSYLIEEVSGDSYAHYLNEKLFKPAEMHRTGLYDNSEMYTNEAKGYSFEDEKFQDAINWDMTQAMGAGAIYSTAQDLVKWNKHLYGGKIIPHNLMDKALAPTKLNDGSDKEYGFGIAVSEYRGQQQYGHSGGLHGFLSYLAYFPELDAHIVVLSNCFPARYVVPANLAHELIDLFYSNQLEENTEIDVDKSNYPAYSGRYKLINGALMTITHEGDHLYTQLPGQQKFEIFPKGKDEFFLKAVQAELKFNWRGTEVASVNLKQNGMNMELTRFEERKGIELEQGAFSRFEGEYLMKGATVKVWSEADKYLFQVIGQPVFEILPRTANHFFMTDMDVEIMFDEGDPAPGATLYQAGMEFELERKSIK